MNIDSRHLALLTNRGLVVSEPFESDHLSHPNGVMIGKPSSVRGNGISDYSVDWFGITTIDGPSLYLHTDGRKWYVIEGAGEFANEWPSAEDAINDVLSYYFGDSARVAKHAKRGGLKVY